MRKLHTISLYGLYLGYLCDQTDIKVSERYGPFLKALIFNYKFNCCQMFHKPLALSDGLLINFFHLKP